MKSQIVRSPKTKLKSVIIWAVDPFDVQHFEAQGNALRTLESMIDEKTEILPVYVWNGRPLGKIDDRKQIRHQADLLLGKWPKTTLEKQIKGIRVLLAPGGNSTRAEALAKFAKKIHSDLIVLSHHNRTVLKRVFMGSFSESLALTAEVPILVAPARGQPLRKHHSVLFPTDFSAASLAAFEEALKLATEKKLDLTIYYKLEDPLSYATEPAFGYSSRQLADFRAEAKVQLDSMKAQAVNAKVKVSTILDDRPGHIGHSVVNESEKGYGLIIMAAHKGFWDRALLGSVSRYVLREAKVAVWIVRPKAKKKTAALRQAIRSSERLSNAAQNYLV